MVINSRIDKFGYSHIYILEYHIALRMSELLLYATTWENLTKIMLREGSQTQKSIHHMIPFM